MCEQNGKTKKDKDAKLFALLGPESSLGKVMSLKGFALQKACRRESRELHLKSTAKSISQRTKKTAFEEGTEHLPVQNPFEHAVCFPERDEVHEVIMNASRGSLNFMQASRC